MAAPITKTPGPASARTAFALLFGLVLGLALWKFGNPVILDSRFASPASFSEAWSQAWPPRWSPWFLAPVAAFGGWLALAGKGRSLGPRALLRSQRDVRQREPLSPALSPSDGARESMGKPAMVVYPGHFLIWLLPLAWFGWQLVSAAQTVDATLTALTLAHFGGCVACYFLGWWGIEREKSLYLLLLGVLAAFAFCLVRASDQKFFEFPQDKLTMLEGERTGWTNFSAEAVAQMKADGAIITTNGVDKANPMILQKYDKGRVSGTLIYPNGLAGAVLLLLPVTLALAVHGTRAFRTPTRCAVISLTLFLGLGSLLWSGSKSGWLIALAVLAVVAFRRPWPTRWKWAVLLLGLVLGLGAFGVRFHRYFSAGATSVGARFDYWHAAARNTLEHPVVGSGPGTFQRPYARLKRPESEMTRLAHNDFLEQFSDSGVPGGLTYLGWIGLLLATLGRRTWRDPDPLGFAVFLGLLGWFAQGFSEFGLYIPALAWTAFALAGSLLSLTHSTSQSRDRS